MPSVLVTGSNRGLGLEWCRQYAAAGWRVYATCRHPDRADALKMLAQEHPGVSLHRLDVTAADQLAGIAAELADTPLDLLVNNAGVYFERWDRDPLGAIDYGAWEETFRVNTLGAVRVTEALADNLARGERPLVATITSHMGSIAEIGSPRSYAYRSSKAALNATMKGLALELQGRGVGVLLLHPGWVKTRMGGADAPHEVDKSVHGMRQLIERFRPDDSGHFYRWDGTTIPW